MRGEIIATVRSPVSQITRIGRYGFVNAYLVSEDDGLTLIDTLLPRSAAMDAAIAHAG
jgi:hypothetical protein